MQMMHIPVLSSSTYCPPTSTSSTAILARNKFLPAPQKLGNNCGGESFSSKTVNFPKWKAGSAASKGRKTPHENSEGVFLTEETTTRSSEDDGASVLLDVNGHPDVNGHSGAAGDVASKNGAQSEYDGFFDSANRKWVEHEVEVEVGSKKELLDGEYGDLAAEGMIENADSERQGGDYWGEFENREGKNGREASTTVMEGTTEGMDKEENRRFRVRNGREVFEERAYMVGIDRKGAGGRALFGIQDSLDELAQLADTAGLTIVGSTYQKLENPNPKTYIGGGKVAELKAAIQAFKAETVIFDDELSPGQARNLEKAFGDDVRVCDRTALILDIFSQRAATREATLQVELAQFEYQLPRLTKLWTHLERQAGGLVKGMGEKQIEVDKRILRTRISALRKDLESVREHRQQYRDRRADVPIPVISLVGYTNAGKSTFLNRLTGANVLAEDRLFATLDPTTRRVELPNGKECLFTDTVGFIQKLPTQLVAAFRATLEEITDSSLLLHMVDVSHPMATQQIEAVNKVLAELDVRHIPVLTVWNKIDKAKDPELLREEAAQRDDVVCISALTGDGMDDFYHAVEQRIKDMMVWVEAIVPYAQGDLVNIVHRLGIVDQEEYTEQGTLLRAYVPLALSRQLLPLRQACT
ncbi:unnamed protein product [Calypogeia fissa]